MDINYFRHIVTDFEVRLDFYCVGICNLCELILDSAVLNHSAVVINLKVSLVDVDDDVEILVAAVFLGKHSLEHVAEDVHHGFTVDVLKLLKFGEGVD